MEDTIFLIAGSVITILCFYFIAAPFYSKKEARQKNQPKLEDEMSIELIYAAVNELEMDYLMKKMTKEDFQQMKMRYQMMAAELMKFEEKQVRHDHPVPLEIDREILIELRNIRKKKGMQVG
jgi:hypothetical protein